MVTQEQAFQVLSNKGLTKTKEEVSAALAGTDQQLNFDSQRARRTVAVWDKQSQINGLDPEFIIERYSITPETNAFLLYLDGNLQMFQPFHPEHSGNSPMTKEEALAIANQKADDMASQDADRMTLDQLYQLLAN